VTSFTAGYEERKTRFDAPGESPMNDTNVTPLAAYEEVIDHGDIPSIESRDALI
jgi:hypothetical protein